MKKVLKNISKVLFSLLLIVSIFGTVNKNSTTDDYTIKSIIDDNLVGGNNTTYDSNHNNSEYARIGDLDNGKPGYFTLKQN